MAQRYDIGRSYPSGPVFSGTAITLTFTMTQPEETDGWNAGFFVKHDPADDACLLIKTPSQLVVGTLMTRGKWQQTLSRTDTLVLIPPATYWYSFERLDPGSEAVLSYGQIQMDRKVNS